MNDNFKAMDLLNLISFYAQISNIKQDEDESKYIHNIIYAIGREIDLLHKENDEIIEQNNQIIKLLKEK